jgi:hypothetical protein
MSQHISIYTKFIYCNSYVNFEFNIVDDIDYQWIINNMKVLNKLGIIT